MKIKCDFEQILFGIGGEIECLTTSGQSLDWNSIAQIVVSTIAVGVAIYVPWKQRRNEEAVRLELLAKEQVAILVALKHDLYELNKEFLRISEMSETEMAEKISSEKFQPMSVTDSLDDALKNPELLRIAGSSFVKLSHAVQEAEVLVDVFLSQMPGYIIEKEVIKEFCLEYFSVMNEVREAVEEISNDAPQLFQTAHGSS